MEPSLSSSAEPSPETTESASKPSPLSRTPEQWIVAGDSARDRHLWEAAANAYRSALQLRPELAHIWVQLGNMEKERKNILEAEHAYLQSIHLLPDEADVHLQYGHLLKIAQRIDEAAISYKRAVTLDPSLVPARTELNHLAQRGVKGDDHSQQRERAVPEYVIFSPISPQEGSRVAINPEYVSSLVEIDPQRVTINLPDGGAVSVAMSLEQVIARLRGARLAE
jgi:tetratricopeptide (TPR) repeat protein